MRSLRIGTAGGLSLSVAREWKGMAFSTCRDLGRTRLHERRAVPTEHEPWEASLRQTETGNESDLTGQGLGEFVVRSIEKLRFKEL